MKKVYWEIKAADFAQKIRAHYHVSLELCWKWIEESTKCKKGRGDVLSCGESEEVWDYIDEFFGDYEKAFGKESLIRKYGDDPMPLSKYQNMRARLAERKASI